MWTTHLVVDSTWFRKLYIYAPRCPSCRVNKEEEFCPSERKLTRLRWTYRRAGVHIKPKEMEETGWLSRLLKWASIERGWETPIQTCATKDATLLSHLIFQKSHGRSMTHYRNFCSSWESEHCAEAGIWSKEKSIGMNITRRRVGMDICRDARRKDKDGRLWFVSGTPWTKSPRDLRRVLEIPHRN